MGSRYYDENGVIRKRVSFDPPPLNDLSKAGVMFYGDDGLVYERISLPDGWVPPVTSRTVPFATNNGVAGGVNSAFSNGTDTAKTYRTYHKAIVEVTEVQLAFANYEVRGGNTGGEMAGLNPITIAASIEYPIGSGTFYPLTFSGSLQTTIQTSGQLFSDFKAVQIPANAAFHVYTYVTVSAGQKWPFCFETYGSNGEGSGDGNLTAGGTITTGHIYQYGPVGLYGKSNTNKPAYGGVGDSTMAGQGDSTGRGFIGRAMEAAGNPYIKVARGGEFMSIFANPTKHAKRLELLKYCTHILVNHGINDMRITPGLTLATMQTNARAIWNALATAIPGVKIYQVAVNPNSSSTNNWRDVVSQVAFAQASLRAQWNQWLRSNPTETNLTGTLNLTAGLENSQDDSLWAIKAGATSGTVSAQQTGDGTHPNDAGYQTKADLLTPQLPSL